MGPPLCELLRFIAAEETHFNGRIRRGGYICYLDVAGYERGASSLNTKSDGANRGHMTDGMGKLALPRPELGSPGSGG